MLRTPRWPTVLVVAAILAACGGGDAERLFPPMDSSDAGTAADASDDASLDAADDVTSDVADDVPDEGAPIACKDVSDCPPPQKPCVLPVCAGGHCDTVFAPPGADVPEPVQIPGDCKRLECDGQGGLVAKTDVDDRPAENECIQTSCDGPNPRVENRPAGTPCEGNRVCNGKGECGVCVPGAKVCDGKVPYLCDENGVWKHGAPCPDACKDGDCVDD